MTDAFRRWSKATLKPALALIAGSCASLAILHPTNVRAEDGPFNQFPLVLHCKYKNTYHAFYLSKITEDGVATYMASDRIIGTISLDGQAKVTGNDGGGSCVGKTLKELRAAGQVYDPK
jgi:hypothetical protein